MGLLPKPAGVVESGHIVYRGTDMLVATSRPPMLARTMVQGPPAQWILSYSDPDPGHAGLVYQLACSLTATIGIAVGLGETCPVVPLDPDDLFFLSLAPSPIFSPT